MYMTARSGVRFNGIFSDNFLVQVAVHQGSVLSPLLFIAVLKALSTETRSGCSKVLYADDLALLSETIEGLKGRLEAWKGALESKG